MRRLPKRRALPDATSQKLKQETGRIVKASERKAEAAKRYGNARKAKWFTPVIDELRRMSGAGECCMFCSRNEASQVEHFRPKAVFPELALNWENFLWACGICNLAKRDSFPMNPNEILINPIEENVWDFFFIDNFGLLTPKWRAESNEQDPRAVSTLKIIALDRQTLQETRQRCLNDLKRQVKDSLALFKRGQLSKKQLKKRIKDWRANLSQPDVADYFLNGPGRQEKPFANLFKSIA